jgi:hypothetical protein
MLEDYQDQKRKQFAKMRSITDYGMGTFFLLLGLLFLLHNMLGFDFGNNKSPVMDVFFGIIAVLYGGWRIYRGYKKNYFK